jgi:hypothetical protein
MSSPDFAGFFASGQPSAGRELGDPIDREVSQSRLDRAIEKIPKILLAGSNPCEAANQNFLIISNL